MNRLQLKRRLTGGASCAVLASLFAAPIDVLAADWLTITDGDVSTGKNVVQIDPTPVSVDGPIRMMHVRVSRPADRTSTDGVVFRSFSSVVEFNCTANTARFIKADFYTAPLWSGPISKTLIYASDKVRSMEFRSIEPNPKDRVMRAVCSIGSTNGR